MWIYRMHSFQKEAVLPRIEKDHSERKEFHPAVLEFRSGGMDGADPRPTLGHDWRIAGRLHIHGTGQGHAST